MRGIVTMPLRRFPDEAEAGKAPEAPEAAEGNVLPMWRPAVGRRVVSRVRANFWNVEGVAPRNMKAARSVGKLLTKGIDPVGCHVMSITGKLGTVRSVVTEECFATMIDVVKPATENNPTCNKGGGTFAKVPPIKARGWGGGYGPHAPKVGINGAA